MRRDPQGETMVYLKTCCANARNSDVGSESDVYKFQMNTYDGRSVMGKRWSDVSCLSHVTYYFLCLIHSRGIVCT